MLVSGSGAKVAGNSAFSEPRDGHWHPSGMVNSLGSPQKELVDKGSQRSGGATHD